jgi:hypothetical protein
MGVNRKEPLELLLEEFAGERALALGRVAARMERALADLRAFDAGQAEGDATREDLIAAAAEMVWFYVVQREVMGWHRHEDALRFYGVPAEVMLKMGPRRRA